MTKFDIETENYEACSTYQLADDEAAYGPDAGKFIVVSADREVEFSGPMSQRDATAYAAVLAALDHLLEQTVDQDPKYGITPTEGEEDARARALAAFELATGRVAARPASSTRTAPFGSRPPSSVQGGSGPRARDTRCGGTASPTPPAARSSASRARRG